MAIHVDTPTPLDSCPGRDRWEAFRGEPYFVFVDESFNRFFELDSRFGYFCHTALGIPQSRYEALQRLIQPVFNDYQQLTSPNATEFKHADFKRIAFADRLDLATRLAATLRENGAIVGAFYTPTASYILEKARWILVGEANALPDDMAALFAQASAQLREGDPRRTGQNRQLVDTAKPTFHRRPRLVRCYFGLSSVRKSVWTLVRQLRGPHLSTCA